MATPIGLKKVTNEFKIQALRLSLRRVGRCFWTDCAGQTGFASLAAKFLRVSSRAKFSKETRWA